MQYFKKSLPILQKILKNNVTTNTCLISEIILVCYVKNKKQLDLAHKLMNIGETLETVVSGIKWDEKKSFEDLGAEVIGGLVDFFGTPINNINQPEYTARPFVEREQQNENNRNNFGSTIPGPGPGPGPGSLPLFMTNQFPFSFGVLGEMGSTQRSSQRSGSRQ